MTFTYSFAAAKYILIPKTTKKKKKKELAGLTDISSLLEAFLSYQIFDNYAKVEYA